MFIVVSFLTGMARLIVRGGNDERWDENSAIARAEFAAYGFRDPLLHEIYIGKMAIYFPSGAGPRPQAPHSPNPRNPRCGLGSIIHGLVNPMQSLDWVAFKDSGEFNL